MSYDVIMSSSFCLDEYPNNHGCEFTNVLNQPLDIDEPNESWAVALREITYEPDFWQNVRTGFNECEIKLGKFKCYLTDYHMIQARQLKLLDDVKFPSDPSLPFTATAVLVHNKYETMLPVETFTVTKPNSFDVFGNQIIWTNIIGSLGVLIIIIAILGF